MASPVVFEAVLPQVVFGASGEFVFSTEITLSNPSNDVALLELEVLRSSGADAAAEMSRNWIVINEFDRFSELSPDGRTVQVFENRFYRELEPHSVTQISFRGNDAPNATVFLGWAILRSNSRISATQKLAAQYANNPTKITSAALAANVVSSISATLLGVNRSCPIPGPPPHGFSNSTTALAVVNPGTEVSGITLDYNGIVREFGLAPRSQRSFSVGDFFGYAQGAYLPSDLQCENFRFPLTITGTRPFALTALLQAITVDLNGNILDFSPSRSDSLPLAFDGPGGPSFNGNLLTAGEQPFDFPVPVLDRQQFGRFGITLTRFGALLGVPVQQLTFVRVHNATRIVSNAAAGLAVLRGGMTTPLVFLQSQKVLVLDRGSMGDDRLLITDLPEVGRIRVTLGIPCNRVNILIDKNSESVISTTTSVDPGAFCL